MEKPNLFKFFVDKLPTNTQPRTRQELREYIESNLNILFDNRPLPDGYVDEIFEIVSRNVTLID